jgi:hypothetical protein
MIENPLIEYIPKSQLHNLNIEAFNLIIFNTYEHQQTTFQVCDPASGHGKTTALKRLITYIIDAEVRVPLLIVTRRLS